MKSYEAIHDAIAGKTIEHAKALHLAAPIVHKWQEPSTDFTDSGNLNPLDRIETIIHTALRIDNSKDPYAPLHYLATVCSHVAIPIPRTGSNLKDLTKELLDAVREFGALAEEASKAISDGDLSKREYEKIETHGLRACREIMEFLSRAKSSSK